jgi:hypothetical protein
MDTTEIQGRYSAEFEFAGTWEARASVAERLALAAGFFAALSPWQSANYFGGVIAAGLAVGWFVCDQKHQVCRAQAERGRRAVLLIGGLGETVATSEILDLNSQFSTHPEMGNRKENPEFFASRLPAGNGRLAEMLLESAFWTSFLARKSAEKAWLIVSAYAILALLAVGISLVVGTAALSHWVLQAALIALTAVFSDRRVGAAMAYNRMAASSHTIVHRLEEARARGVPRTDLLLIFMDYNSIVESAPMFLDGIYTKNAPLVDSLWKQYLASGDDRSARRDSPRLS